MLSQRSKIPNATICKLVDGQIIQLQTHDLFKEGVYILVGVPGAYTPICTKDHIPSLIAHADAIRAQGVKEIFCISDDNPWTIDVWKKTIPGHEKITFLSDGNKDFLEATKLKNDQRDYFIGGGYGRFYMILEDGIIRRVRYEVTVLETVCTNGESILSDIEDVMTQRAQAS
jgi:peroxiredoxin